MTAGVLSVGMIVAILSIVYFLFSAAFGKAGTIALKRAVASFVVLLICLGILWMVPDDSAAEDQDSGQDVMPVVTPPAAGAS